MFKIFDINGKFYQFALKYSQLLWVSILTLVCGIPIVTIGASVTAMHKVLFDIRKDQENGITRTFFRTFRENFKQATLIWLVFLLFFTIVILDYFLIPTMGSFLHLIVSYTMPLILIVGLICLCWVFVLQFRYRNTVLGTIRLAFIVGVTHPLKTVVMLVLLVTPLLLLIQYMAFAPLVLGVAFPLCGLLRSMVYSTVFEKLEKPAETE